MLKKLAQLRLSYFFYLEEEMLNHEYSYHPGSQVLCHVIAHA